MIKGGVESPVGGFSIHSVLWTESTSVLKYFNDEDNAQHVFMLILKHLH